MPLSRSFRDTVMRRMERDPAFRKALLSEAAQALLRDYIHGTIGF